MGDDSKIDPSNEDSNNATFDSDKVDELIYSDMEVGKLNLLLTCSYLTYLI